jgi:hypothetical protein
MTRPITTVLTEALIIGVMNIILIMGLDKLKVPMVPLIAGALIHLIFEYTGGNKWWCTQTYKL